MKILPISISNKYKNISFEKFQNDKARKISYKMLNDLWGNADKNHVEKVIDFLDKTSLVTLKTANFDKELGLFAIINKKEIENSPYKTFYEYGLNNLKKIFADKEIKGENINKKNEFLIKTNECIILDSIYINFKKPQMLLHD